MKKFIIACLCIGVVIGLIIGFRTGSKKDDNPFAESSASSEGTQEIAEASSVPFEEKNTENDESPETPPTDKPTPTPTPEEKEEEQEPDSSKDYDFKYYREVEDTPGSLTKEEREKIDNNDISLDIEKAMQENEMSNYFYDADKRYSQEEAAGLIEQINTSIDRFCDIAFNMDENTSDYTDQLKEVFSKTYYNAPPYLEDYYYVFKELGTVSKYNGHRIINCMTTKSLDDISVVFAQCAVNANMQNDYLPEKRDYDFWAEFGFVDNGGTLEMASFNLRSSTNELKVFAKEEDKNSLYLVDTGNYKAWNMIDPVAFLDEVEFEDAEVIEMEEGVVYEEDDSGNLQKVN